jgi:hypothetical protein
MRKRAKAPKAITYQLIGREDELTSGMYDLLDRLVAEHHEELERGCARIVLAWCTSWKPDVDGRVTIGKCKKASDLDRELAPFDFVILLSKHFWLGASETQRAALIDHELMHAAVKYDDAGEPVIDARGRTVFRTRKHDLEEFADVVARHGCYKRDLEHFARALDRARVRSGSGWIGYSSIAARLQLAGFIVPVERIVEWREEDRRAVAEWLTVRDELLKTPRGSASVPPAPACVQASAVQPSVLQQTGA